MSDGNATTTEAMAAAAADTADVLDCGSLDGNDFETIQVGMDGWSMSQYSVIRGWDDNVMT